MTGQTILRWQAVDAGFLVDTEGGEYRGRRLVIAAGSWTNDLLGDLGLNLTVRRKPQYWFLPATPEVYRAASGYPAYLYELPEGVFYGIPALDEFGVKVAEHSGGALVRSRAWTQMIADALGRPLGLSREEEATSRGSALLALESLGRLRAFPAATAPGDLVEPDPHRHASYREALARQRELDERV